MSHQWGYSKKDGPDTWAEIAPDGNGKRQSPIDIKPTECQHDPSLNSPPLSWDYRAEKPVDLLNNGHSVQVNYHGNKPCLEGGPLEHKYALEQFHLHWGKSKATGSEHRINDNMYAAELHLVHWNTELCKSFGEAASKDNGLCVLGIFLEESEDAGDHAGFKQMSDLLEKVSYYGDKIPVSSLDPQQLLPSSTAEYWTYPGSLTTPPLYESVTWVVFQDTIKVSPAQMTKLRTLHEDKKGVTATNDFAGHIVENYRPPKPLNGRKVRASFKYIVVM